VAQGRIRVVVAKPGLDGHDRGRQGGGQGAARRRHGGHLHRAAPDPEQIVAAVVQEDADAVGLSIHSGAHMTLFPRVVELLRERGADDVLVFGGGIIPREDIALLKEQGVAEIFTPGTPTGKIVEWLRAALDQAA
jgi:methylmalonyl-CoA mutase C-terminal domain/subunit